MTDAVMDDLFAPRPVVERPYFQTTPLPAASLRDAIAAAVLQDDAVLEILRRHGKPMAPSRVHKVGQAHGRRLPITSVRRSMTNLERAGILRKGPAVDGPMGRPEHTWGLA